MTMATYPSGQETLTVTSNTETAWLDIEGPVWVSGYGTWDTATATIQRQTKAAGAVAIVDGAFTVDFDKVVDFPEDAINRVRVAVTSVGASTDLDFLVQPASKHKRQSY